MIGICYTLHTEPEKLFEKETMNEITNSDIFVEEVSVYLSPEERREQLEIRREVSLGKIHLDQLVLDGRFLDFARAMDRILFNSKKSWLLEECPVTQEEKKRSRDHYLKAWEEFYQSNIKECLNYAYKAAELAAEQLLKRDEHFADQLISIQERNPEKNIFTVRGAIHTPLLHSLVKKGIKPKVIFHHKPFVYDEWGEAVRRFVFNKRTEELTLLKSFVTGLVGEYYELRYCPSYDSMLKAKKITEKLTFREIESLSDHIYRKWWKRRDKLGMNVLYLYVAKYFGIK